MPKKGKKGGKSKKKGKGKKGGKDKTPKDPKKWLAAFKAAEAEYKAEEMKSFLSKHDLPAENVPVEPDYPFEESDDGLEDDLDDIEGPIKHINQSELLGRSFNQYSDRFNLTNPTGRPRRFDKSLISLQHHNAAPQEKVIPHMWEKSSFVLEPDDDLMQIPGSDNVVTSKWDIRGHPKPKLKLPVRPVTVSPEPTPKKPDLLDSPTERAMVAEAKAFLQKKNQKPKISRGKWRIGQLAKKVKKGELIQQTILGSVLANKLYTPEERELAYVIGILPKFEVFSQLKVTRLFHIANEAKILRFNAGAVVTEEGDAGRYVYFIISGQARVRMSVTTGQITKNDRDNASGVGTGAGDNDPNFWEKYSGKGGVYTVGRYVEVKTIGKFDMFGEDTMFRDTYLLSVSAVTDIEVFAIDRMNILQHLDFPTRFKLSRRSEINMRIRDQHEGVLRREFARARAVPTDFQLYVKEGGVRVPLLGKPTVMHKQARLGVVDSKPDLPVNKNVGGKDLFGADVNDGSKPPRNKNSPTNNSKSNHNSPKNVAFAAKSNANSPTNNNNNNNTTSPTNNTRVPGISFADHLTSSLESDRSSILSASSADHPGRVANRLDRHAAAPQSNYLKGRGPRQLSKTEKAPRSMTKSKSVPSGLKKYPGRRPLYRSKNPFDRYDQYMRETHLREKAELRNVMLSDGDWLAQMVMEDSKRANNLKSQVRPDDPIESKGFRPFPAKPPPRMTDSQPFDLRESMNQPDALDMFTLGHNDSSPSKTNEGAPDLRVKGNMFMDTKALQNSQDDLVHPAEQKKSPPKYKQYRETPGANINSTAPYDQIIVTYPREWFKANARHLYPKAPGVTPAKLHPRPVQAAS